MRPTTTKEFRELIQVFGATCTKASMMLGVANLLTKLSDTDEIPLLVINLPAIAPLVSIANAHKESLTLEILCDYFASVEHYNHILEKGTVIGSEIREEPRELRPVLHTLLPLDVDGVYRNAGIELQLSSLVQFGEAKGTGFWAAHLAGKIWIPRGEKYRKHLLEIQSRNKVFVSALRKVAVEQAIFDYKNYPRLLRQTNEAKD